MLKYEKEGRNSQDVTMENNIVVFKNRNQIYNQKLSLNLVSYAYHNLQVCFVYRAVVSYDNERVDSSYSAGVT